MNFGRLTPLLVGQCPGDWQRVFIDEVTDLLTNGYVGPSLPFQTDDPEIGVRPQWHYLKLPEGVVRTAVEVVGARRGGVP